MSKYIDADLCVEMQIYDDEHEEWSIWNGTIEDLLNQWTEQGCPTPIEVSEDCISREQTIEAIDGVNWYHVNPVGELVSGATSKGEAWYKAEDIYKAIESLVLSVAPKAKEGEWIYRSEDGRIKYPWWESCECNKCGEYGSRAYNFCPNCGAKMKG